MKRRDGLDELSVDEQKALQVLLSRLLRLDAGSASRAMSRVTLLWLDWMERWEDRAAEPMRCETDQPEQAARQRRRALMEGEPVDDDLDPEVGSAIDVLRQSQARFCICDFLVEVAKIDGITHEEEDFLDLVRSRLDQYGGSGPYR